MLEKDYKKDWYSMSEPAILRELASFVKETRLKKNYTQHDLAVKAGVHRVTLSEFEQGMRSISIGTFIELLRGLEELELLDVFKLTTDISPLQMAKLEAQKRKRASATKKIKKIVRKTLATRAKKKK
ncbi:MAG: helix-turn-helix transcriptional regulator [Bacteroidetes bacterium]|nr:helix-turn-helix transcriptional regulator [Bacteroidota bacterium]